MNNSEIRRCRGQLTRRPPCAKGVTKPITEPGRPRLRVPRPDRQGQPGGTACGDPRTPPRRMLPLPATQGDGTWARPNPYRFSFESVVTRPRGAPGGPRSFRRPNGCWRGASCHLGSHRGVSGWRASGPNTAGGGDPVARNRGGVLILSPCSGGASRPEWAAEHSAGPADRRSVLVAAGSVAIEGSARRNLGGYRGRRPGVPSRCLLQRGFRCAGCPVPLRG